MKKYISKITELVAHNRKVFLWILFISATITLLSLIINNLLISPALDGFSFANLKLDSIEPFLEEIVDSAFVIRVITGFVIIVAFSAFAEGGFLTYLDNGKRDEKSLYITSFFKNCKAKWWKMFGATLSRCMMIFVYALIAISILIIPQVFAELFMDTSSMSSSLIMIAGVILSIIAVFVIISGLILTFFITFEAALSKKTSIGVWLRNAFNKGKKVYWQLFLWILVAIILVAGTFVTAMSRDYQYYILTFCLLIISWCFRAFILYPLYRLAGEKYEL
ncbi:MAG: hypothetical protein R2883_06645 [Caldisericia bacterium]